MPELGTIRMFLNGTAMSGGADHHLGAGPSWWPGPPPRAVPVPRGGRALPGLEDVGLGSPTGAAVEGEVYELSYDSCARCCCPVSRPAWSSG